MNIHFIVSVSLSARKPVKVLFLYSNRTAYLIDSFYEFRNIPQIN